ncbi:hypothetical protein [Amycolatopsis lurida]|uniref:Uncharacterized protein n=1 Tax=Amycolatopsis lurida NRRL 2430 TaxID=1460371 RepID=A0A2P2FUC8_AMYLU|nr:hypothetical protein [Amycolatopsis lurida]KFU80341.1 hypothetical protein BB31_16080 [Amycolatopsis lurida NRRL 2430]
MPESNSTEDSQGAAPPGRTGKRIAGGIFLILASMALFYVGVDAIADPDAVISRSSNSSRSPDTEAEAKIGGFLLFMFGVTVLGFGIGMIVSKGPLFAKRKD